MIKAHLVIVFLFSEEVHLRILYINIVGGTGYGGSYVEDREDQL